MIAIKLASRLLTIMLGYYITYNTYFGWNKTPQSESEEICDYILKVGVYIAFGIFINPLVDRYKFLVQKWENEKNLKP